MSSTQVVKTALSEHKVIPDVLPETIDPSYELTIHWPNATLDTPGKKLACEDTRPEPTITIKPTPTEPLTNLVLIMADPDLMKTNDTNTGQVRHWLATNLTSNPDGTLSHFAAAERSPYVRPAPLPDARPHRYVFILARPASNSKVEVRPEDLRAMQTAFPMAVSGTQGAAQDLKDRWGFDAGRLCEEKGLRVLGVNFMRVEGTRESLQANLGLMGEAAVDKAVGK
ncbi:PEBP-like protein [Decorospora gaudefroyi]|uniref:PEBP-like protein n=1 Tax=Decorospora gaudefroyi TaxID=184978 RepID=A0A6A5KCZ9_9PLEO|nr:PEBP-like protein [Decorospora gaudefroyi]